MDITNLQGPHVTPPSQAAAPPEIMAQNRELIQAVKSVNAAQKFGQDNELTYLFDRQSHRPIFRLIDRKTRQVIQQIPPERVLEIARERHQ